MRRPSVPRKFQFTMGLALLPLLSWPELRNWLEAGMWRQMVLQFPLWLLCGMLLTAGVGHRARTGLRRWNVQGITGLVLTGIVLSVLMIPRVLDLSLTDANVEMAKLCALLLSGFSTRLSWGAAGLVVQGFFLGNLLPMMVVVGQLYIDSPLRLCNAYLMEDQQRLGHWLVGAAVLTTMVWLGHAIRYMVLREATCSRT